MKYIVGNEKHLKKAEDLYNSFPENFQQQIESIEMHFLGLILMIRFKTIFSNKIVLPSNLSNITIKEGTLETFGTGITITAEIQNVNKLEIILDEKIKI